MNLDAVIGPNQFLASFYPIILDHETIRIDMVVLDITERCRAELAQVKLTRAAVDAIVSTT